MKWIPVYKRELRMLMRRMGNLGYLFSGLLFPMIYLLAFGWGLGDSVNVAGGYIGFLAKGMMAISVMMNSFQQTVTGLVDLRPFLLRVITPEHEYQMLALAVQNLDDS